MSNETGPGPISQYGDLSRRARPELEAKGINPDEAIAAYNETGNIEALTGSITIIPPRVEQELPAEPAAPAAPAAPASAQPAIVPVPASSIFPEGLSRRDEVSIGQRLTAEIPTIPSAETEREPEFEEPEIEESQAEDSVAEDSVAEDSGVDVSGAEEVDALEPEETEAVESDEQEIDEIEAAEPVEVVIEELVVDEADEADEDEAVETDSEDVEDAEQDEEPHEVVPIDLEPVEIEAVRIDQREDREEITNEFEPFTITTTSTGIIPTTSHALVLPTLPEEDPDLIAAMNQTGEIVITGQITLPAGIASVGADTASLDTADIDLIVEDVETGSGQDLAPVSAAQAVSSFSGTAINVTMPKRSSEKLPVILAVSAAVLALGVVGLFVANYFLRVF